MADLSVQWRSLRRRLDEIQKTPSEAYNAAAAGPASERVRGLNRRLVQNYCEAFDNLYLQASVALDLARFTFFYGKNAVFWSDERAHDFERVQDMLDRADEDLISITENRPEAEVLPRADRLDFISQEFHLRRVTAYSHDERPSTGGRLPETVIQETRMMQVTFARDDADLLLDRARIALDLIRHGGDKEADRIEAEDALKQARAIIWDTLPWFENFEARLANDGKPPPVTAVPKPPEP